MVKMANITEAERIAHYLAKQQSAIAVSWTGGLTFLVALCALSFNIWAHFSKDNEEVKRRKRADELDRARRRRQDEEDKERRRKKEEEADERRRQKKKEEEAEREEAGRETQKGRIKAAETLEEMIEEYRYVRFNGGLFISHHALRLSRDPIGANIFWDNSLMIFCRKE